MIITGKEKNLGTSAGRGRLHYLAGSARAERRGQPGCSTPTHLYDDDDLGDLDDDVMMVVIIHFHHYYDDSLLHQMPVFGFGCIFWSI